MQTVNRLGHSQGGVVLLVGMVMVLLMTIVGLSAIRGTGMQEQMAGNMRDLNLAFQATEAALREGEAAISDNLGNFDASVNGFYLNLSHPDSDPAFSDMAHWGKNDWLSNRSVVAASVGDGDGLLADTPRYVVEELSYECDSGSGVNWGGGANSQSIIHRVTSRGVGGTENSVAVLQSTYILTPCI